MILDLNFRNSLFSLLEVFNIPLLKVYFLFDVSFVCFARKLGTTYEQNNLVA